MKIRRRVALALGGLLLAAGASLVWIALPAVRFERHVARLRSMGEPVTVAELRSPEVPSGENGAREFTGAYAWYRDVEGQTGTRRCTKSEPRDWTDEDWRDAVEYVRACEPFVEMLRRGVAAGGFALDVAWENGADAEIVTIPLAQMASEVLVCNAMLGARAGPPARAADALSLLLDVADRQERFSSLTYRVRLTVYGIVAEAIREMVSMDAPGSPVIGTTVGSRLAAIEAPELLADALRGERAMTLWVLENVVACRGDGVLGRRRVMADACHYLDAVQALIELSREDGRAPALARVTAIVDGERGAGRGSDVSTMTLPKYAALFVERARTIAAVRMTRLGLAILAYRAEAGDWPTDLTQLPLRLEDPRDGGPFRYTRLADRVRLSSAASQVDEGIAWELR